MADEVIVSAKSQVVIISLQADGKVGIQNYLGVVTAMDMLRLGVIFHRLGNEFLAAACPPIREDATAHY